MKLNIRHLKATGMAMAAGLTILAATAGPAAAGAGCQFVLGFKTLHDAIPDVTGECQDDQVFASIGDAVQHTTTGLMVGARRRTPPVSPNGALTWLVGPFGVQGGRGNSQRYEWEIRPGGGPQLVDQTTANRVLMFQQFISYWVAVRAVTNTADYAQLPSVVTPTRMVQIRQLLDGLRAQRLQPHLDVKLFPEPVVCVKDTAGSVYDQIAEHDTVTDPSGKTVLDSTVNKIVAADFQLSTDWLVTNVRDVSPGESALAGLGC